jgi:hypothetical protein
MYEALSTTELAAPQEALYTATEPACRAASLALHNQGWLARCGPSTPSPTARL